MEPNKILSADVLDLIFEDRNKAYGAYDLRKTYNKRIVKALDHHSFGSHPGIGRVIPCRYTGRSNQQEGEDR